MPPVKCRAIHAFNAEDDGDLSLEEGIIVIATENQGGWWYGYLESSGPSGPKGSFPANHVQAVGKDDEAASTMYGNIDSESTDTTHLIAMHDHHSSAPGDLNFVKGDKLVGTRLRSDWWDGYLENEPNVKGKFPANYVQIVGIPAKEKKEKTLLVALHSFEDAEDGELQFSKGDYILGYSLSGSWWEGEHQETGERGTFPANYVTAAAEQNDRSNYQHNEGEMDGASPAVQSTRKSARKQGNLSESEAAIKIQSCSRGHLSRKITQRHQSRTHAATRIQAQARGREARQDFNDQRGAATAIQAQMRGNMARRKHPGLGKISRQSATTQNASASIEYNPELETLPPRNAYETEKNRRRNYYNKTKHATPKYKNRSHRKDTRKRLSQDEATIKLQAFARGNAARDYAEDLRDFNAAATMIQSQARGREAREDFRDQKGAAIHIQAVTRGNRVRSEYPELAGNRRRLRTGEKRQHFFRSRKHQNRAQRRKYNYSSGSSSQKSHIQPKTRQGEPVKYRRKEDATMMSEVQRLGTAQIKNFNRRNTSRNGVQSDMAFRPDSAVSLSATSVARYSATEETLRDQIEARDIVDTLAELADQVIDLGTMQMEPDYNLRLPKKKANPDMIRGWEVRKYINRINPKDIDMSRFKPRSPRNPNPHSQRRSPRQVPLTSYHEKRRTPHNEQYFAMKRKIAATPPQRSWSGAGGIPQGEMPETPSKEDISDALQREREAYLEHTGRGSSKAATGDDHLDAEGNLPLRSARMMKMLEKHTFVDNNLDSTMTVTGYFDNSEREERRMKKGRKGRSGKAHYMMSKTWPTTAKASRPSAAIDRSNEDIRHRLELEHVHGFSAETTRNSLLYTVNGDILYIAAALGVVMNPETKEQRFMSSHTDDILSIASFDVKTKNARGGSRGKKKSYTCVATGEIGRSPKIIVWESNRMRVLATIQNAHERGVAQLAFSPDGSMLASIGLDNENSLALHKWRKGTMLARVRTGGDKVFGLMFRPLHRESKTPPSKRVKTGTRGSVSIVTCGHKHLTFWRRPSEKVLKDSAARFGRKLAGSVSIVDVCFDKAGRTIAATSKGHLCVWLETSEMLPFGRGSVEGAHGKFPINSVEVVPGGSQILSGAVDGKIILWNCPSSLKKSLSPVATFDSFAGVSTNPSVQSISVNLKRRILVGTRGGEALELSLDDGAMLREEPLTTGHNFGELWGLAAHPRDPNVFATSGDDKTIRLWHIMYRGSFAKTEPGSILDMSRALCFTPGTGKYLAAGLGGRVGGRKTGDYGKHAGKIHILDGESLAVLKTASVAKEQISDIAFSNDGKTLAIASNDNFIHIIDFAGPTRLKRRAKCKGHSSYVTDISLSQNSKYMMSNDGAGEILFWRLDNGKRLTKLDKLKEAQWMPITCPLSWATQGIWPDDGDLTDINGVMATDDYIICADDFGKVRLFNSPAMEWCAPSMVHRGHSSHVTNICFNADSSYVISVGGNDKCAFVWKMVTDSNEASDYDSDMYEEL